MQLSIQTSIEEKGRKARQWDLVDATGEERKTLAEHLAFIKQTLIQVSLEAVRDEQTRGFTKSPLLVVDRKPGKQLLDVSPLGEVEFIDPITNPMFILEIFEGLITRSRTITGTYVNSHYVFHNGNQIGNTWAEVSSWVRSNTLKPRDKIRFVNIMPYARRLELLGVTATRHGEGPQMRKSRDKQKRSGDLVRMDAGAYFLTYRSIKRKSKFSLVPRYETIPGNMLGIDNLIIARPDRPGVFRRKFKGHVKGEKKGKNFRKRGSGSYVYPSILLTVQGSNVEGPKE